MRNDDPWEGIKPVDDSDAIHARRMPGIGSPEWGLYWAKDARRRCLLVLHVRSNSRPSQRLPKLRGLLVEYLQVEGGAGQRVVIRLTDGEQRDIFHRFCLDVAEATRVAHSGMDAIGRFLARTWRWHRLLKSGREGRLSDEEQKGLIGELVLLERHLLGAVPAGEAVEAWVGPIGAPKDYQIGLTCVEVKAPGPQTATISISSIHQLDATGTTCLFLYVIEIAAALDETHSAVTVSEVADRVRSAIAAQDGSATIVFDERLTATGFDWEDDYSDKHWIIGEESLFEVLEGFPRVTPSMVPPGVDNVRYVIALSACGKFQVDTEALRQQVAGEHDER